MVIDKKQADSFFDPGADSLHVFAQGIFDRTDHSFIGLRILLKGLGIIKYKFHFDFPQQEVEIGENPLDQLSVFLEDIGIVFFHWGNPLGLVDQFFQGNFFIPLELVFFLIDVHAEYFVKNQFSDVVKAQKVVIARWGQD